MAIVVLLLASTAQGLPGAGASQPLEETTWQVASTVDASVVDNYATVEVGVDVHNPAAGGEYPFVVQLPDEAFVTGLAITRNGTTYEADVEPRDQARDRYERARTEGRSASLVEQGRDRSTYRYDVSVGPNQTVRAVLTYETYLVAHDGEYTLPLVAPATPAGEENGTRFDVHLAHASGLEGAVSDPATDVEQREGSLSLTYEADPRSPGNASTFDVHYRTNATEPGGRLVATVENGTGYFAHRFQAPADRARMPVDLALVLDRSGSMSGAKIAQLESATRRVVDHLDERDRVHLTTFSHEATSPWEGFGSVDGDLAQRLDERLASLEADGGTNIEDGIGDGFAAFGDRGDADRRLPAVAFLTDGKATAGLQDNDGLRELAIEANTADAHVFGLAFGERADWGLVHGLAEDADGHAERVPVGQGTEVDLERFLTRLTSPVFGNVSVDYEQASVDAWRLGAPVLFSGGELLYVGTFDPNVTRLEASVHAQGATSDVAEDVWAAVEEEGGEHLPRLVAYHRVRELEDRIDAHGPNETWEKQALELALEHGFVTEQTSLVVDLPRASPLDEGSPDASDDVADSLGEATGQAQVDETARQVDWDRGSRPTGEAADEGAEAEPAQTPALGLGVVSLVVAGLALARSRRR